MNKGACRRCGNCCKTVIINSRLDISREELAEKIIWLEAHGMKVKQDGDCLSVQVYAPCMYLRKHPETGKHECLVYRERPAVCREYFCGGDNEPAEKVEREKRTAKP